MSDYFEKLGSLLNEALEKGEIPKEKVETVNQDSFIEQPATNNDSKKNSQQNLKKETITRHFFFNKKNNTQAEIIHKNEYVYNNQLSPELQNAFNILNLPYSSSWKEVNKRYHFLLKQNHPDTKKSEQENTTQINDLQNAYQLIKNFFQK